MVVVTQRKESIAGVLGLLALTERSEFKGEEWKDLAEAGDKVLQNPSSTPSNQSNKHDFLDNYERIIRKS